MSKDIGEYKQGSSVGDIEGISRGTEDSISSINFDDDLIIDDTYEPLTASLPLRSWLEFGRSRRVPARASPWLCPAEC